MAHPKMLRWVARLAALSATMRPKTTPDSPTAHCRTQSPPSLQI